MSRCHSSCAPNFLCCCQWRTVKRQRGWCYQNHHHRSRFLLCPSALWLDCKASGRRNTRTLYGLDTRIKWEKIISKILLKPFQNQPCYAVVSMTEANRWGQSDKKSISQREAAIGMFVRRTYSLCQQAICSYFQRGPSAPQQPPVLLRANQYQIPVWRCTCA